MQIFRAFFIKIFAYINNFEYFCSLNRAHSTHTHKKIMLI